MPRIARVVVPGIPHHVTQRGNRGTDVFVDADDRERYLSVISNYARRYGADIWAYCLMTNHVHFVMLPHSPDSLARTLRDTQRSHAVYLNEKLNQRGHLWHGRYFSCALDEGHLWAAVRYVERNPVRAGLVAAAHDHPWSSAAAHCGIRADSLLSADFPPPDVVPDWSDWLADAGADAAALDTLRTNTRSGRPCGSPSFVERIEAALARILRPRKRGPKPKGERKGE